MLTVARPWRKKTKTSAPVPQGQLLIRATARSQRAGVAWSWCGMDVEASVSLVHKIYLVARLPLPHAAQLRPVRTAPQGAYGPGLANGYVRCCVSSRDSAHTSAPRRRHPLNGEQGRLIRLRPTETCRARRVGCMVREGWGRDACLRHHPSSTSVRTHLGSRAADGRGPSEQVMVEEGAES